MAAAASDGAAGAACPGFEADSYGELSKVEGGGAADLKDAALGGAEAAGDSEEDGEDVFEVEQILDMKTEGGRVLYKVRWKGYTSDDDTWEPEVHLEDCKEVLLEFQNKVVENRAKPVKKDIQGARQDPTMDRLPSCHNEAYIPTHWSDETSLWTSVYNVQLLSVEEAWSLWRKPTWMLQNMSTIQTLTLTKT